MYSLFILFTFFSGISVYGVNGGTYCTVDSSYSYTTRTKYCEHGCCGNSIDDNRRCCDAPTETHVSTGVYVGGGVGGFFSFLFVLCCIYYCCCRVETLVHVI
ncbi:uncharacterized protein LOC128548394 [Mercenaria mercenaria]|uniref:uncharacterized protein LOC128548394 n=1 Tax=Mercenaria mercenaria TaxID=6596 RepID=UPI00234E96A2|nr:uncharacterized protein LOC128548394 [Mercenaria mercenaria]